MLFGAGASNESRLLSWTNTLERSGVNGNLCYDSKGILQEMLRHVNNILSLQKGYFSIGMGLREGKTFSRGPNQG